MIRVTLVCLILFTLVRTEHSRYMLPASAAVSMLVAKIFADMGKSGADWLSYKISLVVTGIIFLVLAIATGRTLYVLNLIYHIPASFFTLPILFFIASIIYSLSLKPSFLTSTKLVIGYFDMPDGISVIATNRTEVKVEGIDKQLVGAVAAKIRSFRPPEPYKGKGIRYKGEYVRSKQGKTVGAK